MTNTGDTNKWEVKFINSQQESQETHDDELCCYKPLTDWIIVETSEPVHLLIRVCRCTKRTSKDHLLKRTTIYYEEVDDGAEIHRSPQCCYVRHRKPEERKYKIVKVCYCPRR